MQAGERKKMKTKANNNSDQEDGQGGDDHDTSSEDDDEDGNHQHVQIKKPMNSHDLSSIRTLNYSFNSQKPNLSVDSAYNQHQFGQSYLEPNSVQANMQSQPYGWMKDAQSGYYTQSLNLQLPISSILTTNSNKYTSQQANMPSDQQI